jgi:outer membrane protein assembly factor BamB
MRAVRVSLVLVLLVVIGGCSGGGAATSPTSAPRPASTAPSSQLQVMDVIDIGGPEAYGLAVNAEAVYAISYQAGSMARIDPTTGSVQTIPLGPGAATLLNDGGSTGSKLYRVNAATGQVVATIDAGELCCDLTVGGGAIWAVDPRGSVMRVDRASNRIVRRLDVPIDRTVHTNAVYGGDSLWVSSDSTMLFRVNLASGAIERIDVGGGVPFVAHDGLIWGAAPARLWAVDQDTGEVVRRIELQNSIEVISLGLGFDAIWVGIRRPDRIGTVLRLDQQTGAVVAETTEVDIPARIEFGFEAVWITDSGGSSVYRISPVLP